MLSQAFFEEDDLTNRFYYLRFACGVVTFAFVALTRLDQIQRP